MNYRVVKRVEGTAIYWIPQASFLWFPKWFGFYSYSSKTQAEAWDRCKRHALGSTETYDRLRVGDYIAGVIFITAFFGIVATTLICVLNKHGRLEWLKSLIF